MTIQDHPWKNEQGVVSAKTAVSWWMTTCFMMGVSASTAAKTSLLLADDLERKGYP